MKRADGIKSAALVWAESENSIHQTAMLAEDRGWLDVHVKSGSLFYRRASAHLEEAGFADGLWRQPRTRIMGRAPVLPGLLALFLAMTTWGQITETNSFPELNLAVPDDNAFGVEDHRVVTSEIAELTGIKVRLQIAGNFNGDIYAYLRHTSATTTNSHLAVLLNRVGRSDTNNYGYSDDGFDVTLSDQAGNDIHVYRDVVKPAAGSPLIGEWQPDARFVDPFEVTTSSTRWAFLSNLNGMGAAGEWTLFVADLDPGGTNMLVGWSLEFAGKIYPQVRWTPPAPLIYGGSLTTNELNASANVPGTFNYVPRLGTVLAAGNAQTLAVTFQPDDTNQFVSIRTNVTVDILPRELVVTAFDTNKTYGEALLINDHQFSAVGLLPNENIAGITLASLGTAADAPAGSYLITPGSIVGNLDTNNYRISYVAGTLVVNPAPLTAQVEPAWRFYGQPNPPFTVTYSGFVNSEDISILQEIPACSCSATTNSPIGDYVISATGQSAPNYSLTYHAGTLSVRPAPLLITVQDASRFYGQTNPPFVITFNGLVNGDDTNALSGILSLDCAAVPTSPVASYPIIPSGLIASNYNIVFSNAVLTVDPASSDCALLSSTDMAAPGESLTFSVHVRLEPASEVVPTGEVIFRIADAEAGTPITLDAGRAALTTNIAIRGWHNITVEYCGNTNVLGSTNSLTPPQLVDTTPTAATVNLTRTLSGSSKISLNYLLANSRDADGGAVVFDGLNFAAQNGGGVVLTNGWIIYTPSENGTDTLTYTIKDSFGITSTGSVTISSAPDTAAAAALTIAGFTNGNCLLEIAGTPWGTYLLEARNDFGLDNQWRNLGILRLDASGRAAWQDPSAHCRFFRAKYRGEVAVATEDYAMTTDLNASPLLTAPGSPVEFNVAMIPRSGGLAPPQGTIQFLVDGLNLGSPVQLNQGTATFSTTALGWGRHQIEALFQSGDLFPDCEISLDRPLIVDTRPIAGDYQLQGATSKGIKMPVSELFSVASDPDGEPLSINLASTTSAEGGSITLADGWLYYKPSSGQLGQDAFAYFAQDTLGLNSTGSVNISPVVISKNYPAIQIIELASDTYRLQFSGVPWFSYTIQFAEASENAVWNDLTTCFADAQGLVQQDVSLPPTTGSHFFRALCDDTGTTASPFQRACWDHFVAITNNRVMDLWTQRSLPAGWPTNPPLLVWNTNCLIYGIEGFTAISQCNEFEGALGQIPATLITKRHALVRGHGMGDSGFWTNRLAGKKVWFCTATNQIVTMTIAADYIRYGFFNGQYYDYGLLIFSADIPATLQPISVMTLAEFGLFCQPNRDTPYLVLGTEQSGHVATGGDLIEPFVFPLWKGGDSGSPDFFIAPDHKLVMISNRGGTGISPQVAADVDALTLWAGLNPADYQLDWYDMSPWAP